MKSEHKLEFEIDPEALLRPPANRGDFDSWLAVQPMHVDLKAHAKRLAALFPEECADLEWQLARAQQFDHRLALSISAIAVPEALTERLLQITHLQTEAAPGFVASIPQASNLPIASPSQRAQTVRPISAARRWSVHFAIAAAVAAVGFGLLFNDPMRGFSGQCAKHLSHEPFALTRTAPVPTELLQRGLKQVGYAGSMDLSDITYAMPCVVAEQKALHTVVQTPSGPITVLVFSGKQSFPAGESHHGASTVRVAPFEGGAFVLLAESSREFDQLEMRLIHSVRS